MATLGYVKDRRKWRVRWRATNRRTKYVFAGSRYFWDKSQAVRFFADIEQQERLVRSMEVRPAESIVSIMADFNQHIKRFTYRTQQHYRMVMTKFVDSLPSNTMRIHQIEAAHLREYLYRLRDNGAKNRTLNAHLTALKSFCRFYSSNLKIANPADATRMLTEDR